MISNFSEVEKSLKRCLKEKVSITAATVVGFLIAGTVALGAEKAVEFTTADNKGVPKVTVQVVGVDPADVDGATNSISVEQYEALTDTVEATKGALAGLLTVTTDSEGVTTFALGEGDTENNTLGTVTAKATENGEITLIKTDGEHTSITSSLKIEATGFSASETATAMEALEGHTVTNDGTITVGKYAVGMSATTIEDKTTTLTNEGTITVKAGTGIEAKGAGSAVVNGTGTIDVIDGTGINATLSEKSKFNITTGSIKTAGSKIGIKVTGKDANAAGTTEATVTTTLGETKGTGVEVTGKAYNDITVNLKGDTEGAVTGTGVEIVSNADTTGKVVVNVDQSNLSVADKKELVKVTANAGDATINAKQAVGLLEGANLVNVTANTGTLTVNLDAVGQSVATGSLVNLDTDAAGTINVNINQDVKFADTVEYKGNIVKAGTIASGNLNVNLNVKEGSLNVKEGITALDLAAITGGTTSVKNTGNVTIEEKGTLVNGSAKTTLTNQGVIDLTTVTSEKAKIANNSKISTGTGVAVNNYGTIKLAMTSEEFMEKVKAVENEKQVTKFEDLALEQVIAVLQDLKVISDDNFTTVGYIKLTDGLFTTAKALSSNDTVDNLASILEQKDSDRAFRVTSDIELTQNNKDNELKDVQFNLEKIMTIKGTTPVNINNANSSKQIIIEEAGQLKVDASAVLNYSGNILASEEGTEPAITIENGGTLTLSNGTLTVGPMPAEKNEDGTMLIDDKTNRVGIKLVKDAEAFVVLDNSTINADIEGTLTTSKDLKGTITSTGISAINGTVSDIATIKVKDGMLKFGADSKIVSTATGTTTTTTIDLATGNMGVQIGEGGGNVLRATDKDHINITNLDVKSSQDAEKGKVVLLTDALTENTEFNLGEHTSLKDGAVVANGDIFYKVTKGEGNNWNATFNEDALLEATGTKYLELNNMYIATQAIHDLLEKDNIEVRAAQLDDLYSNSIYSETVKMSLDTLKMNEDAVLSLNVRPKQGEFTAQGKFLFNNTDYDREGVTRDYKVETKNTGLLGAMEYGLTDTSSVGFAFSGTKQDLDMKNGASADGDAFYFGLYRNDTFNNIDLTTGLGYMIDRVDAENFIGKDKFDSTALSGYIQGKYNYAIGENLTLSPKARLTVTRFQQDSINNGRMKQEEIKDTMADVELGVELKKGIALETGKMNLLAGASFTTNVAGKDDDYYKVNFISKAGNNGASTKVKGANLEKNSLKLNLGADVELTNGVFYNGGLSYEFDDEDRDSIGVTLGAGYKF